MKLIKQFTCLVACFVVLSSSFMIGYAVDDEFSFTVDDLYDFGFKYDSTEDIYTYSGWGNPFGGFSFFARSDKNSPDFNPVNDVPWASFPEHIKKIIYMSTDGLLTPEGEAYKMPFLCLSVMGNYVYIYAGINVGLAVLNDSIISCHIMNYGTSDSLAGSLLAPHSCCYFAAYNYKSRVFTTDFTKLEPYAYGDKGVLRLFTSSTVCKASAVGDYYFYGANGVHWSTKISSLSIPYTSVNSNKIAVVLTRKSGFESGDFVSFQYSAFPDCYFQYFVPPSLDTINQQLLNEQNQLQQEQNNKLDNILGVTGNSDSIVDDYNNAESDLVDDYNPDNLEDDLDIDLDNSALNFIWDLVDNFVTADNTVFTLFVSILSLGIIALILGR